MWLMDAVMLQGGTGGEWAIGKATDEGFSWS